jgi:hypothetical protein
MTSEDGSIALPHRPLRLRCKVYQAEGYRYIVAQGILRGGMMHAFAMNDSQTIEIKMTIDEWNALPWYWFQEDGEAPRRMETWPAPERK